METNYKASLIGQIIVQFHSPKGILNFIGLYNICLVYSTWNNLILLTFWISTEFLKKLFLHNEGILLGTFQWPNQCEEPFTNRIIIFIGLYNICLVYTTWNYLILWTFLISTDFLKKLFLHNEEILMGGYFSMAKSMW
jgi:hypothetical protein